MLTTFRKKALHFALILLLSAFIGYGLLVLIFLIPGNSPKIVTHITESLETFITESHYPQAVTGVEHSMLDNYTDGLMLNNAVYNGDENAFMKASKVYKYLYENQTPMESLISLFSGNTDFQKNPYSRYWHGYLVVLKPLLLFLNYPEIRLLNSGLQLILFALVICALTYKKKKEYVLPFSLCILSLMPVSVGLSLQYSAIYYISLLAALVLLLFGDCLQEKHLLPEFFLFIGILVNYFDFFTYPLFALGLPLCVVFFLYDKLNLRESIGMFVKTCFSFGFGYSMMWLLKWLVGTVITGDNIFKSALDKCAERTSTTAFDTTITISDTLKLNLGIFATKKMLLLLIVVVFALICYNLYRKVTVSSILTCILPYGATALLPVLWYVFASNHSYIHHNFTFRTFSMAIFAYLCMLVQLVINAKQTSDTVVETP